MNENPSLCIPRVSMNITKNFVASIFEKVCFGKIARIDIITRKNDRGDEYQRIFVHFHYWFSNEYASKMREKIIEGKEIKIVYDNPWFWKVSVNISNHRPRTHLKK